jgi:hypothetical protein
MLTSYVARNPNLSLETIAETFDLDLDTVKKIFDAKHRG